MSETLFVNPLREPAAPKPTVQRSSPHSKGQKSILSKVFSLSSPSSAAFGICPLCIKPVAKDKRVACAGAPWHPECLECGGTGDKGCRILLPKADFKTFQANPYCDNCFTDAQAPILAAQQARRRDKQVKIAMDKLKQEKDARDLIEKEINDKLAEERRLQKLEDDKNAAQAARDAIINNPKLNYFNSISFSTPAPAPGTFDYLSPLPVDGISPTASTVPPTVNSSISPISLTASWLEKVTTSEKGLYMENAMPTEMKLCPMSAEQVI